ncbi:hypothetical protein [Gordonia cholesterolivorans]|uniref:Uncharacterized protein n=1 Tax=Gordonia cholesterolivorans TaxID=559625 RepID=A0ABN3HCC0_9ACTN
MGTYDSIELHGIDFQTKALGRGLATYRIGDEVRLETYANSEEEAAVARTYLYDEVPRRYAFEAVARVHFVVEDGRIVGLADEMTLYDEMGTDVFNIYGRDEHDEIHKLLPGAFEPERPPRTMHPGQPPLESLPKRPRRPGSTNDSLDFLLEED